ncbi:origin recognition complex subunit 4, partial [Coemansia sp. RSA 1935]
YHIVHLNGFVHTTDRIALRDIARQLLITQDLEHVLIGSFADAFTYILNLLRSDDESTAIPPVIFVLEEFDLLAQHPKQSLLYTLFDIAQSQQTPIAVLGVTARIDVLDLLEKRVKSRFSHRQIYVHNMASVEEFVQIAREALCIDSSTVSEAFAQQFNKRIEDILTSSTVSQHIEDIFEFGKDVRMLLRAFTLAVSQISIDNPLLNASTVESQFALTNTSAKMKILSSISLLELCLIIAMRSLTQLDISKYNFEMVYDEYKTFMSRHMMAVSAGGAMKIYKKPVALKAFETLVELEIARPALVSVGEGSSVYGRNDLLAGTAAGIRAPKEYRMVQLMLEPMQVVELVSGRVDIPAVIRSCGARKHSQRSSQYGPQGMSYGYPMSGPMMEPYNNMNMNNMNMNGPMYPLNSGYHNNRIRGQRYHAHAGVNEWPIPANPYMGARSHGRFAEHACTTQRLQHYQSQARYISNSTA